MKLKQLHEARYAGNYPLYYVIYDPHWESRELPDPWASIEKSPTKPTGPFLFFDMGINYSSAEKLSKRKTGRYKTREEAEAAIEKWKKYYKQRTAQRFKISPYRKPDAEYTREVKKRWDIEEQIVNDARVGVVELRMS